MAFSGSRAFSRTFCAAELFAAEEEDSKVAISEEVELGLMKAGLGRVNMSTVYLAVAVDEGIAATGSAGPTRRSRGMWLTKETRASTNCARYLPTWGVPKW